MTKGSVGLRLLMFFVFLFFSYNTIFAQQFAEEQKIDEKSDDLSAEQIVKLPEEKQQKYKPRERKLLVDIPLTIAEISAINMTGNLIWRIAGPDSYVAYFTLDSIRQNLNYKESWHWEEGLNGDTFLTNQFFHPFAGGYYFASARSNNIGFYPSILAAFVGSIQFETFAEIDVPSINDTISTVSGGIIIGEILHRLFIELDKLGPVGRIFASIVSPTDRVTAAVRRYGPDENPLKFHSASLALGFSWINAWFLESGGETIRWSTPCAFIDFNIEYGNPFTAHSVTPFDQFDLNMAFIISPAPLTYTLSFMTDGYVASWYLADDEKNQASNGLTFHNDVYSTDRGTFLELNNGRDNIGFNAVSCDYSLKWRYVINESVEFTLKSHLGITPWACLAYNSKDELMNKNMFSLGANFKLALGFQQITEKENKKHGHSLNLSFNLFRTWDWNGNPGFDNNSYFIYSNIAYSFLFNKKYSLYIADSLQYLNICPTKDAAFLYPEVTRIYDCVQIGVKISLL